MLNIEPRKASRIAVILITLWGIQPFAGTFRCADLFRTPRVFSIDSPVYEGKFIQSKSDETHDAYHLGFGGMAEVYRMIPKDGTPVFIRKFYGLGKYTRTASAEAIRQAAEVDLVALEILRLAIGKLSPKDRRSIRVVEVKDFNPEKAYVDLNDTRGTNLVDLFFQGRITYEQQEPITALLKKLKDIVGSLGPNEFADAVAKSRVNWTAETPGVAYRLESGKVIQIQKIRVDVLKEDNIVVDQAGRLVFVDPR